MGMGTLNAYSANLAILKERQKFILFLAEHVTKEFWEIPDELYSQAVNLVIDMQEASISKLQRKLRK